MTKAEFEEMVYLKLANKDKMLVLDFISYWTETDLKGKKMRFESEKFFDVGRRFSTFEKNERKWKPALKGIKNAIDGTLEAYNQTLKDMGL